MAVSAALVKELRERTGLGMLECKKALTETDGDVELAIDNLRKDSGLKAAKKAGRTAADGVVAIKLADDGSCGVIVEVNSETDFVARDEGFLAFVGKVVDKAFADKAESVEAVVDTALEADRVSLVQKIGEKIGIRRVQFVAAADAVIGGYVHSNNRIAVLVQLSGGTVEVAKDVAMHVAASNPQVVYPEDMSPELLKKEEEVIKAQPDMEGKPAEIVEKMMGGRIKKFLKENSLVEQPFVKNPDQTVGELVKAAGGKIVSVVRYEVGEGIEKKEENFAAEVAAQVAASKK